MTPKHFAIAYIFLIVGWAFVLSVGIVEYHVAQELKNRLHLCQSMQDGTIICQP